MDSTENTYESDGKLRRYSAPRTRLLEQRGKPINRESLREHAFFKDCDPKLMDLLLDMITVQVCMPGFDIMKEGDEGDCMYFLYRGEVEVLVGPAQKQVAVLKDGSIFGEMALLGNGKRAATVRATEVCDCRVLNKETFDFCLKRFPKERRFFERVVKDRQAEIDKTKRTKSPAPPTTPSTALHKFRRASKVVAMCGRMEASSAPTSRTTTESDDLLIRKDQASARSPSAPSALAPHRQRPSSSPERRRRRSSGAGQEAPSVLAPHRQRPSSSPERRRRWSSGAATCDASNHDESEMCRSGVGSCPSSRRQSSSDVAYDASCSAANKMCSPYQAGSEKRSSSRRPVSEMRRAGNEMFSPYWQTGNGHCSSSRRRASDATFDASRQATEMFSPYRETGNRNRSTSVRRSLVFANEAADQAIEEMFSPYRNGRSSSMRRSSEASNKVSAEFLSPLRKPGSARRNELLRTVLSVATPTRAPALNGSLLYMGPAGE